MEITQITIHLQNTSHSLIWVRFFYLKMHISLKVVPLLLKKMKIMTSQEKQQILKYKKEGKSYAFISKLLGINESTVKTICARSKKNDSSRCLCCGKKLLQTKGYRQKKFCDSSCKDKYLNIKQQQRKMVAIMTEHEVKYINTIHQAKNMLKQEIIDINDFIKNEDKIANKYNQEKTNLYHSNYLINTGF